MIELKKSLYKDINKKQKKKKRYIAFLDERDSVGALRNNTYCTI